MADTKTFYQKSIICLWASCPFLHKSQQKDKARKVIWLFCLFWILKFKNATSYENVIYKLVVSKIQMFCAACPYDELSCSETSLESTTAKKLHHEPCELHHHIVMFPHLVQFMEYLPLSYQVHPFRVLCQKRWNLDKSNVWFFDKC